MSMYTQCLNTNESYNGKIIQVLITVMVNCYGTNVQVYVGKKLTVTGVLVPQMLAKTYNQLK